MSKKQATRKKGKVRSYSKEKSTGSLKSDAGNSAGSTESNAGNSAGSTKSATEQEKIPLGGIVLLAAVFTILIVTTLTPAREKKGEGVAPPPATATPFNAQAQQQQIEDEQNIKEVSELCYYVKKVTVDGVKTIVNLAKDKDCKNLKDSLEITFYSVKTSPCPIDTAVMLKTETAESGAKFYTMYWDDCSYTTRRYFVD